MLSQNLGPPPFHDTDDVRRLDHLRRQLDQGDLGKELGWYLTSSDDENGANELSALKDRADHLRQEFTNQRQKGHRIDARSGQPVSVDRDNKPSGSKYPRKKISDLAPETYTFRNRGVGYVPVRASLMHKYFPRT